MGNSLLCHYIDNCFKKGIILWGQKHCDWGGKVEEWGAFAPPSYNVKKGSDAVSFVHKYNPFKQASYPKGRVYRRPGEGPLYTTTGSKTLAGGRRVHVIVAMSYNRGVVLAEKYEKMTGACQARNRNAGH